MISNPQLRQFANAFKQIEEFQVNFAWPTGTLMTKLLGLQEVPRDKRTSPVQIIGLSSKSTLDNRLAVLCLEGDFSF